MSGEATRKADAVLAPRWSEIGVYASSSTAATANLNLVGPQTPSTKVSERMIGATDRYVRIYAYTTDVVVVFAATSATADDVTFNTAAVNAVTGGVPIVAGTYQDFWVPTDYFWLGFITASAAGTVVVYINSPR